MPSEEVAMEHQFFIRQQNLKLYRSLVAASEAAAAKADARQEKHLMPLAEEVANEPPHRKNYCVCCRHERLNPSIDCIRDEACAWRKSQRCLWLRGQRCHFLRSRHTNWISVTSLLIG